MTIRFYPTLRKTLLSFALGLISYGSTLSAQTYNENWPSLRKHDTPEWFDGLKFGMYFHWGWQTALIQSGDKDLPKLEAIEKWTGKKFDAKNWVDLIEDSGAQFGGPVAWHGSGVLNWDSKLTDWNSVNKGPKVDIFGSLATELRKRDMKVISSYHTSSIWNVMWGPLSKNNPVYLDPKLDHSKYSTANQGRISNYVFDGWYDRLSEAIDTYKPDMVWFDTGFGGTVRSLKKGNAIGGRLLPEGNNEILGIKEAYQKKLISHYFNKGVEWDKEVEVIFKTFDIPTGIGIRDIENGNLIGQQYDPWMSDVNMVHHHEYPAPWFFNPNNPPKDANTLVDMLVDMTSKNGRMLLNVPPQKDGTFSKEIKRELHAMGRWLKINGEAIYDTIPWIFFGEGPTEVTNPGHHGQGKDKGKHIPQYTAEDIRFTQNEDALYAIGLEWPGEEVHIRTLGHRGKLYPNEISSVHLLGHDQALEWQQTADALIVKLPKDPPCDFAYSLKVERK